MAADTWGISGPTFILLYVTGAVVALIFARVARAVLRGRFAAEPRPRPEGEEIAFITGGDHLALDAAQAGLRVGGAITKLPGGQLTVTGPIPANSGELARTVHDAAMSGVRQRNLLANSKVNQALHRIRERLIDRGWLLGPRRIMLTRLAALPVVALVVLGVARTWAGFSNGRPVLLVIAATVVLGLLSVPLLVRVNRCSVAADRLVAQLRIRYAHLAPRRNPSMAEYDLVGAALAVGLFGSVASWAADPVYADAEAKQHQAAAGSSGGGSSGSSDSSDSGGCSGGGCGGGGCGGCGG